MTKNKNKSFETKPISIKRLFLDIETSPNIVLSWQVGYKINIDYSNLLKERAIIVACWKWEGDNTVYAVKWDNHQNDKTLLKQVIKVINDADEIIMHNGDSFDLPWIKTRCLFHGLQTLPTYKTIDTLQWARRRFYFNSNKLDYIAKFLGIGHKIHTEFGLWKEIVLNKSTDAMSKMTKYCQNDVILLEKVWKRLSEVIPHKTHVGVLGGRDVWTCPRDGSNNVKVSKTKITAAGTKQYQMVCNDCGCYYTISERAHAVYLESKKNHK